MSVHLYDGDARRLVRAISLLHEWLGHVDEHVLDDLADFGFYARLEPRRHLEQFLVDLAEHGAALSRQLPAPAGGAA